MHHAGVCVRDIEASLRFYRDGLALTVLADKVLNADLHALLGVHTESVRTVFLGDAEHPDSGIVELLDLGVPGIADQEPQAGLPARGVFLLSLQVDVQAVLARLAGMGLGGTPRVMPTPGGGSGRHRHRPRRGDGRVVADGQALGDEGLEAGFKPHPPRAWTIAERLTLVAAVRGISSTNSTVLGTLYAASRSLA